MPFLSADSVLVSGAEQLIRPRLCCKTKKSCTIQAQERRGAAVTGGAAAVHGAEALSFWSQQTSVCFCQV